MEQKANLYFKIGGILSYTAMFFIFTTILYFILSLTNKLPESWNYITIIIITFLIILIGKSLKYWMEKQ